MPHQHLHVAGLLWFLAISIYTLAAHNISLASISSEVSDDCLPRLVTQTGCRVSLSTCPQYLGRPIGGVGRGAQRALCNTRAPRMKA